MTDKIKLGFQSVTILVQSDGVGTGVCVIYLHQTVFCSWPIYKVGGLWVCCLRQAVCRLGGICLALTRSTVHLYRPDSHFFLIALLMTSSYQTQTVIVWVLCHHKGPFFQSTDFVHFNQIISIKTLNRVNVYVYFSTHAVSD